MSGKVTSPSSQSRLSDIESHALLANGFDDEMDVRMWLVRVQHHRIPVLERELLPRKVLHGYQNLFGRCTGWH
jgi:hypothetical protein